MSPSPIHEELKSAIGRLVGVWCDERGIDFTPFGSWTLERERRAVEPDECFVFSEPKEADQPHLAIEVIWTTGRLNKLEIYRKLNVPEAWFWRRERISVHVLRGEQYDEGAASEVLPGIDLVELVGFFDRPSTSRAMRDYRAALPGARQK